MHFCDRVKVTKYDEYTNAVIVTGDGDFKCLIKFLSHWNKFEMLLVPNQFAYSSLLKRVAGNKLAFITRAKNILELP